MMPDVATLAPLAGLALVDSTSIGTLAVPLLLLTAPGRPRTAPSVVYLATIAGFYWLVGVALLLATRWGLDVATARWAGSDAGAGVALVLGIALFVWSFRLGSPPRGDEHGGDAAERVTSSGRVARWRTRTATATLTTRSVALLALAAGVAELATMLPYLGAIGMIAQETTAVRGSAILVGYCTIMIVPAAALVVFRRALGVRADPLLRRWDRFVTRHADEAVAWIAGIAGFLLARYGVATLFLS